MNPRIILAVAIAIGVVAFSVFLSFPGLRDGAYPQRSDAQAFFEQHQSDFEALYLQLIEDGFSQVLCLPDKVFAGTDPRGVGQPILGESLEVYRPLCKASMAGKGWRTESGFLFQIGGAENDRYEFMLAYVRLEDEPTDIPDCRSVEPAGDFGKCQFELDADWRLDYEWFSRERLD